MPIFINREQYDLLINMERFCNRIEQYLEPLGLDSIQVCSFKTDNKMFKQLFGSPVEYDRSVEQFVYKKLENMQLQYESLKTACKNSKKYTLSIGLDLGIEEDFMAFSAN